MEVDEGKDNQYWDLLPARMLNEFTYCERLFYLEWVEGQWAENEDTIKGRITHRVVDKRSGTLPPPLDVETERDYKATSITLSSSRLRIIAKMDLIDVSGDVVVPIDYKKGAPGDLGPWEPDKIQVCAQGLVLRDNGYKCDEGIIYYAKTKQRMTIYFDAELVQKTSLKIHEALETASRGVAPSPLINSPKCPRCSLVGICLPDEVSILQNKATDEIRRLVPARDDPAPIYCFTQGTTIGVTGERIAIRTPDGRKESVRLIDISQVSIYGNISISAQAIRALIDREIPIFHHSYGGWLVGVTSGLPSRNVDIRVKQYGIASDPEQSLAIAKEIVIAKVKNQRTLLRRNSNDLPPGYWTNLLIFHDLFRLWTMCRCCSDWKGEQLSFILQIFPG